MEEEQAVGISWVDEFCLGGWGEDKWVGGWVGGWVLPGGGFVEEEDAAAAEESAGQAEELSLACVLGGCVGGWVGGWVGG